ncbi:SAF domain-containing protein [Janibacter sp. GXQ6167]|uniref:SAF domain-containing protein n=1 Tax=Janibacter sp. GXQ6167 TaxID=3240791 RepID=UPI0035252767
MTDTASPPTALERAFPTVLGRGRRSRWRRALFRRLLAAALLIGGLHLATSALVPRATGEPVVVATSDVAAGATVSARSVELRRLPADVVPKSASTDLAEVVGRTATVPIGRGEVLSPARVAGSGALARLPPRHRALGIPLAGSDETGAMAGDRVDVYLPGRDQPVVRTALVLDLRRVDPTSPSGPQGSSVVLALTESDIGRLLTASPSEDATGFVLALRPRA